MEDRSRPIPGTQPVPGTTAVSSGPAPDKRGRMVRGDDRRRAPSPPLDAVSAETDRRDADERILLELRRKVQKGDLLSASTERLLWKMRFNGHLTVVIQNGRVVKSGYEEGYFRRRNDMGGFLLDV